MKLSSDINLSGLASSLSLDNSGAVSNKFEEQLKLQLQQSKGYSLEKAPAEEKNPQSKENKKLEQAVQEFEAFFIAQMLKSMRATIPDDGLFKRGHKEKMMEDMMDESLSQSMAKNKGFGLADALYKQMQPPTSQKRHSEISYDSDIKPEEQSKTQTKQQSIMEIGG